VGFSKSWREKPAGDGLAPASSWRVTTSPFDDTSWAVQWWGQGIDGDHWVEAVGLIELQDPHPGMIPGSAAAGSLGLHCSVAGSGGGATRKGRLRTTERTTDPEKKRRGSPYVRESAPLEVGETGFEPATPWSRRAARRSARRGTGWHRFASLRQHWERDRSQFPPSGTVSTR
jgi:hypothetical protein